jgi:hypothetical protein
MKKRMLRSWAVAAAVLIAGCGGSGNPLDNPQSIDNPTGTVSGQKLSFAYFQYCIQPILVKDLPINIDGTISTNKCASSGCHDSVTGTGGAFRLGAGVTDVAITAATEADKELLRATGMYRNYYSARASTVVGSVSQSNLLNKPRVLGVLHGGGLIFLDGTDTNLKLMEYWITHPMPKSGDEFSDSSGMFTTGVPGPTACRDV